MCAGAGLARACVTRQRQHRIDHIHSCENMLGILPAGLTSVPVGLILLAPSFSPALLFSSAGTGILGGAARETGVPVEDLSPDKGR